MKVLFCTKKKGSISTEEILKLFESTDNLEKIKKAVENAEERISVTWASVEMKDNAGELIPIDDIANQQDTLLERGGPISDGHTNRIIGRTLAYKVLEHPETKSKGVLHLDKTYDHNQLDDKIWEEIQSGERVGASVGGFNTHVSLGKDEVTGEQVKVLEGFQQFETASVSDPCNPMALTEAYSVVAKSQVKKPEALDSCVSELVNDPNFKPDNPSQTKEQAAFAVCNTAINKGWYKETDINKESNIENTTKEGDKMSKDIIKAISDLTETVKGLKADFEAMKKQDVPPKEEEEEKPEEEDKKKQNEEEKKPEEKKEEEDETKKEEAASDIEGETDAPAPEAPSPEESNEKDAFKSEVLKRLGKIENRAVAKASTPLPFAGDVKEIKKNKDFAKLSMDLASGKQRLNYMEVNKAWADFQKEAV